MTETYIECDKLNKRVCSVIVGRMSIYFAFIIPAATRSIFAGLSLTNNSY